MFKLSLETNLILSVKGIRYPGGPDHNMHGPGDAYPGEGSWFEVRSLRVMLPDGTAGIAMDASELPKAFLDGLERQIEADNDFEED